MPNLELVFAAGIIERIGGALVAREGPELRRVITAPDQQVAKAIARAMLGEEVSPTIPLFYLGQVLSVRETNLPPCLNSFLCDSCIWNRVVYRLRLVLDQKISGQDTFNGFDYYSPSGSGKTIKAGLIFTEDQRERLLAALPSISL